MNNNDYSNALDLDTELESPLDRFDESDPPLPDPEEMLPLLESPEPQHRMMAARAFCELQDDRAISHLINLALGRNPSSDAVEPLIEQLNRDWNGYVRKGVVWALGNCRDHRALPSLIDALRTDISAVRLWAASSLGQMAKVGYYVVIAGIPPLIEALRRDSVSAVRSNSAWAIGQLARELPNNIVYAGAIDALIEALEEDEDMGVREDAKSSLLRVGDPRGLQIIEDLEMEGLL
ncbi:MAG: HEAT repeat domain-containing protein [Oscillatoriales cyanobacterium]|nr:MAG: HEAT repeat domain-containing protein [Oscillatoriales cyanobacterium]